jgi:hypothetical protein
MNSIHSIDGGDETWKKDTKNRGPSVFSTYWTWNNKKRDFKED